MSLKAYNIDIPITPGVMPPVIHIGQYDSGRDYICHLKNDDGRDYIIPSGTTATFTGCNPRKEVFELDATVDTGANTVLISPEGAATSMFGKYGATLNLELYGERMSPIVILMDVQKAGATDEEIAGAANFPDAVTDAVNDWLEENIDAGQLGDLYIPRAPQAAKTDAMTQPVGMDDDGGLWITPGGGPGPGGGTELFVVSLNAQGVPDKTAAEIYAAWQADYIIQLRSSAGVEYALQSISSTRAIFSTAIDAGSHIQLDAYTIQGSTATHSTLNGYVKPSAGIPQTDLAVYTTTITDTGAGYTADHRLSEILSANAAHKMLLFVFDGLACHVDEVSTNVVRVHAIDEATAGQPTLYTFTITGTGVAGSVTAIGGSSADAVAYTAQTGKTEAEKAQARTNIGASAAPSVVTVTGNTPTITPADNTIYNCIGTEITAVTVSYTYGTEFVLKFNAQPGTPPNLTIDSRITMPDGFTIEANKHYEINVDADGYAVVGSWDLVS